jgi:hypothetical protein
VPPMALRNKALCYLIPPQRVQCWKHVRLCVFLPQQGTEFDSLHGQTERRCPVTPKLPYCGRPGVKCGPRHCLAAASLLIRPHLILANAMTVVSSSPRTLLQSMPSFLHIVSPRNNEYCDCR